MTKESISTMKLFDAQALAQSGVVTSVPVDLREISLRGAFAVHLIQAGAGTTKIEYFVAPTKDGTYLEPSGASDIVGAQAAGSNLIPFTPSLTPWLKIRVTENGVGTITSLDLWLHVQ
jgi:hypothetical protein